MNLIVDIGNTLSKIALVEQGNIIYYEQAETDLAFPVRRAIEQYRPGRAIITIVGPPQPEAIAYLETHTRLLRLNRHTKLPITNAYQTPDTLGYDRIATVVGAHALYPNRNVLVIDCGSAITYDILEKNGTYTGGAISPGLTLRYKALHTFTRKLPLLSVNKSYNALGSSTDSCIHSGVQYGTLMEISGYIQSLSSIYDDLQVVLTGGDAKFFANKLKNSIFVNQKIAVIGLNHILEFNAKQEKTT